MANFQLSKIDQPLSGKEAIAQRLKALLNTPKYQVPLSTFGVDIYNPDLVAAITEEISTFFPDLKVESVSIAGEKIEIFVTLNNETINVRN